MQAIQGISVGVRTSGVWLHISAAGWAAKRCRDREKEYQPSGGEALTELRQQCVVALMLSAAGVEAFSNEILFDREKVKDKTGKETAFVGLNFDENRDAFNSYKAQYSPASPSTPKTADPLKVCDIYLRKMTSSGLDIDTRLSVDEEAHALFRVRNAYVHYWPEWSDQAVLHAEVGTLLTGRFPDGPQALPPGSGLFPDRCLGFGFARWAVRSAVTFIHSIETRAGVNSRYSQAEMPLDPAFL